MSMIITQDLLDKINENPFQYISILNGEANIEKTRRNMDINVYPGSFNPLHGAHKWIEWYANYNGFNPFYYEICINPQNKPALNLDQINERLSRFSPEQNILISRASLMIEKMGLYSFFNTKEVILHVGFDTLERMINQHGPLFVRGTRCRFVLYSRFIDGRERTISDLPYFNELADLILWHTKMPERFMKISSTQIRNGEL